MKLIIAIIQPDKLDEVHQALIDAVRPFGAAPDEPAFTGSEFRPHITIKNHGRIETGTAVTLTQIALVDMAARTATSGRTVLATVDLSASLHGAEQAVGQRSTPRSLR